MSSPEQPQAATSTVHMWDGFVNGVSARCKCGEMTNEKVTQVAGIILAFFAVTIFVTALMVQYPTAANTFFTLFGLGGVASLATFIVALVKQCQAQDGAKSTAIASNQLGDESVAQQ